MNSTLKFLVGEEVERIMDGLVGKVVEISTYNGEFSYAVDLGREPMEGFIDDVWSGTGEAWRPILRTHAHVYTRSADCDGEYTRSHVDRPSAIERTEEFGELNFRERVMNSVVSLYSPGVLHVTEEGLAWAQSTDEGYVQSGVAWCEKDNCNNKTTQQDFRAESMGY